MMNMYISTLVVYFIMFGLCTGLPHDSDDTGHRGDRAYFAGADHIRTKRGADDIELSRVKRVENPPIIDELTNNSGEHTLSRVKRILTETRERTKRHTLQYNVKDSAMKNKMV